MLISILYDFFLLLALVFSLPWIFWKIFKEKKYRSHWKEKLGWKVPYIKKGPVIWIHAVSVGETKAVSALYQSLKQSLPEVQWVISSVTETGFAEAKRSLPDATAYFFLPLDFSFVMRKLIRKIHPNLVLLVEGDFWYQMLRSVKKRGGKVCLVNGKISEKSTRRFCYVPRFSQRLFNLIDFFCLQNDSYISRFKSLGVSLSKMAAVGNLKLDVPIKLISKEEREKRKKIWHLKPEDFVITIGSTHLHEEEQLLSSLKPLFKEFSQLKILLVPRHPERFSSVAKWLCAQTFLSETLSRVETGHSSSFDCLLIDRMGILMNCYQISDLAIVGGSFVSHIGGHNIFEPISCGIPVFFGPYMRQQLELVQTVLKGEAGEEVSVTALIERIRFLLENPQEIEEYKERAIRLAHQSGGSLEQTRALLQPWLPLERGLDQ
jgi:3-deoxy-D-manno-octulosonic-acid transferase